MFAERTEVMVESISPLKLKIVLVNILYRKVVILHNKADEKHIPLVNLRNQPKQLVAFENNMKGLEESLSVGIQ